MAWWRCGSGNLLWLGLAVVADHMVRAQPDEDNNNAADNDPFDDESLDRDGDSGGLFFNGTHYGYGDHFVYSTTEPISYALYVSLVLVVTIVVGSIWFYGCPAAIAAELLRQRRVQSLIQQDVMSKKENLLPANPYAAVDELLERFHGEVKHSEVLDDYDEEEQNSYTRSVTYLGEDTDDEDDATNDNNDEEAAADGRISQSQKKKRRPPVVNGYYSTTPDDLILEYNEDMYLEFVPIRGHENFCTIQGYGKYNTGNVRVEGLVASTGEAYWYEVPFDDKTGKNAATTAGPVAVARGTFALRRPTVDNKKDNQDLYVDSGQKVGFVGHWYRPTGVRGGIYKLFSHKVVFKNNAGVRSVAPSVAAEEFSTTGEVDLQYDIADDHDDEVIQLRGNDSGDGSSTTRRRHAGVVVFGALDGPGVSNLSNEEWSLAESDIYIETGERHQRESV
jgi:hypothetical protein